MSIRLTLSNSTALIFALALAMLAPRAIAQSHLQAPAAPKGISPLDWSAIRRAHEVEKFKVVETQAGFRAHNSGQRWDVNFNENGGTLAPSNGSWSWGLQLESYGFAGAMRHRPNTGCAIGTGNKVTYDWGLGLEEWFVNDARGLEHGFTLASRPQGGSGPLIVEMHVLGKLRPEVLSGGRGVRFLDEQGAMILTYNGLLVLDAKGDKFPAILQVEESTLRILVDEGDAEYPLVIDPIAQQAYLKASNTESSDHFGYSVAVSGDRVVVGANAERSNATGIDGDQTDNSAPLAGAVYIFERSNGIWSQRAYLKASNSQSQDTFGESVAIDGDLVVVGAHRESSDATGVNGDQQNDNAVGSGAAYVFEFVNGVWIQQAYLKPADSDAGDSFGISVAISGERIAVGAIGDDSSIPGVNSDPFDNGLSASGAVYVFGRTAGTWSQRAYLKASNPDGNDSYGRSVAISGNSVIVGAQSEDSSAAGVGGDQLDNSAEECGAAYIFAFTGGAWVQEAYLKASNSQAWDYFGSAVAISGDLAVVGAKHEGSGWPGVGGNQQNNSAPNAGAAYVFVRSSGSWSQQEYLKASNAGSYQRYGQAVAMSGNRILIGAREERSDATGINGDQDNIRGYMSGAAYLYELAAGSWKQLAYIKASNSSYPDYFGVAVGISGDLAVVGADREASNATGVNGDQTDNSALYSGAAYVFDIGLPSANYCDHGTLNSSGQSAIIGMTGSVVVADNAFTLEASQLPANYYGYFLSSRGQAYRIHPGGSPGVLCLGGLSPIGRHLDSMRSSGPFGEITYTPDLMCIPTPWSCTAIQAGETWNFQCWFRDNDQNNHSNFTNGLSVLFE